MSLHTAPSILSEPIFRRLVVESIQALANQVSSSGIEVVNDSGNPIPTSDKYSGSKGFTAFTGTTARTGNWYAIQILSDTVFSTLTTSIANDGDTLAGVTIPAGNVIYGPFTAITLTSGKAIAYKS
jgi:hypothetical protein